MEKKVENDGLVKTENVVMGIIGALIGSLAGVAAIILLDMIGFIASVSGVVMGAATLFMYEKLAGKISKKGIIICVIIMIIMVLIGNNLAWSIAIARELKVTVFDVFPRLYPVITTSGLTGDYIRGILALYAFTLLGAFGIIKSKLELIKNS